MVGRSEPRGPAGREAAWGLSRSPTRTAARAAWHQTRVSRVRGSGLRLWPSGRSSFLRVMLLALLGHGRALLDARLCGDFRGAVRGPSEAPLPPASLGPARCQGCPLQGKPGPRGRRAQEAGSQSSSRSWSVEQVVFPWLAKTSRQSSSFQPVLGECRLRTPCS